MTWAKYEEAQLQADAVEARRETKRIALGVRLADACGDLAHCALNVPILVNTESEDPLPTGKSLQDYTDTVKAILLEIAEE